MTGKDLICWASKQELEALRPDRPPTHEVTLKAHIKSARTWHHCRLEIYRRFHDHNSHLLIKVIGNVIHNMKIVSYIVELLDC
jgi:hypothetical protein